jgi:hypothetical protein
MSQLHKNTKKYFTKIRTELQQLENLEEFSNTLIDDILFRLHITFSRIESEIIKERKRLSNEDK